ncbi:MAG: hypothetical protein QM535_15155 [Limnohabitans sp.]|nr:hypothetical protein [Limnohabitans sp.]
MISSKNTIYSFPLFFILFFCIVLAITACTKSNTVNNLTANQLFPLKVGNTWLYDRIDSSASRNGDTNSIRFFGPPETFGNYTYFSIYLKNVTTGYVAEGPLSDVRYDSYNINGKTYPAYYAYSNGPGLVLTPDSFTPIGAKNDNLYFVDAPEGTSYNRPSTFTYIYKGINEIPINTGGVVDTFFTGDTLYNTDQYNITSTNYSATINGTNYTGLFVLQGNSIGYRAAGPSRTPYHSNTFPYASFNRMFKRGIGVVYIFSTINFSTNERYQKHSWTLISSSVTP